MIAFTRNAKDIIGWRGAVLLAIGVGLIGSLAGAGHAAGTPGLPGKLHVTADALHLVAAAAWVGGLLPLALLLATARRGADLALAVVAREATRRFSALGMVSVATIVATGIVNTWMLAGSMPALVGTDYGQLLVLKIGLFIAMVAIAAFNRLRLTPRLASANASSKLCERSDATALIEAAVGLAHPGHRRRARYAPTGIARSALVAVHAAAEQPHLRRSRTSHNDAGFDGRMHPRPARSNNRHPAAAPPVAHDHHRLPGNRRSARGLRALTEEAFPTSYWASPTGYSVRSITRVRLSCSRTLCAVPRGHGPWRRTGGR